MKLSECVSILVFSQIYSFVCLGVVQSGMYLEFVNTRVIKHDVETYFALHMKYFIFFTDISEYGTFYKYIIYHGYQNFYQAVAET